MNALAYNQRVGKDGVLYFKKFNGQKFSPEVVAEMACGSMNELLAEEYASELISYLLSAVGAVSIAEDLYDEVSQKQAVWKFMEGARRIASQGMVFLSRYPNASARLGDAITASFFASTGYVFVGYGGIGQISESGKKVCVSTYIVKNPTSGLIKIGKSVSPVDRIKSLETGAGGQLETLAIYRENIERELHMLFSDQRVFGEWFCDDGEILKYIKGRAA